MQSDTTFNRPRVFVERFSAPEQSALNQRPNSSVFTLNCAVCSIAIRSPFPLTTARVRGQAVGFRRLPSFTAAGRGVAQPGRVGNRRTPVRERPPDIAAPARDSILAGKTARRSAGLNRFG